MRRGAALFILSLCALSCSGNQPTEVGKPKPRPSGPTSIETQFFLEYEQVAHPYADTQAVIIPPGGNGAMGFYFVIHCDTESFRPTHMEVESALPFVGKKYGLGFLDSAYVFTCDLKDFNLVARSFPVTFRYTGTNGGDTSSKTVLIRFAPDVFKVTPRQDTVIANVGANYGFAVNYTAKYYTPIQVRVYDSIADTTWTLKPNDVSNGYFLLHTVPIDKPDGVYDMKIMLTGPQAIGDTGVYHVKVVG